MIDHNQFKHNSLVLHTCSSTFSWFSVETSISNINYLPFQSLFGYIICSIRPLSLEELKETGDAKIQTTGQVRQNRQTHPAVKHWRTADRAVRLAEQADSFSVSWPNCSRVTLGHHFAAQGAVCVILHVCLYSWVADWLRVTSNLKWPLTDETNTLW